MSQLISKITSKIFMLILGIMISLSIFFETISYIDTVDTFERHEMKRLKSVVKTQSLYLESVAMDLADTMASGIEYDAIRTELENSLTNANRLNDLQQGLSFILINNNNGHAEIISSDRTSGIENADPNVRSILDNLPIAPVEKGLNETDQEKILFYAYPITFPGIKSYRGYLYLKEEIREDIAQAKSRLFRKLIMAFLLISILGFLGKKYLDKVFRQEVNAKEKLKEYATIVQARNKELERLSFVLEKSENLILLTDKDGNVEWVNQRSKNTNSYTAQELNDFPGKSLLEVSHYSHIEGVIKIVKETKKKHIYQTKSSDQFGNDIWTSTTVTPILNEDNEVDTILFVDADVTKLKLAEIEISHLANFAEESSSALMRFKTNGETLFANSAGKELLSLWGTQVGSMLKKSSILNTIKLAASLEQDQQLNLESDQRIYNLRFHPVFGGEYINVYAEDITEIKLAEKEYRDRASLIEKHNLNITDSINYAKRIQDAIIPGENQLQKHFSDSFLIYKPKDIVSGDFVWLHDSKPNEEYLLALADCTGHGVPGAMMSIIGHSLLNEIVEGEEITDPARILEELNKEVIKTLRQKIDGESSDGMDVGIVKINIPEMTVTFAGAFQDIYWTNGKVTILKGDRQPIGGKHQLFTRKFQNHTFQISKGDSIFLASDGFVDQFGGPKNKKFLKKRFSEMIRNNYGSSMHKQAAIYEKTFEDWKGPYDQVDDVSVVGIKI